MTANGDEAAEQPTQAPAGPKRRGARAEQRQKSRIRLIEAARTFAVEGRFQSGSLDEIAKLAGLSRAAYYLHFKSKEELLVAVLDDQMDRAERRFSLLSQRQAASRSGIVAWLQGFVDMYRHTGQLSSLYYLNAFEFHRARAFHDRRLTAIRLLGRGVGRLRLYGDDGTVDRHREIKLLLYLYQLEQTTFNLAMLDGALDMAATLDDLAANFQALMD